MDSVNTGNTTTQAVVTASQSRLYLLCAVFGAFWDESSKGNKLQLHFDPHSRGQRSGVLIVIVKEHKF